MYKFTSSPWGFRFYDFEKYCRFMKRLGITEICAMFGDTDKLILSFKNKEEEIKKKKEIANNIGVNFVEIALTGNYREEIPLAPLLGVKYLRICDNWEESEESFKKVTNMLKEAGNIAEDFNLIVIVENHGGLMRTGKMCREIFEKVNMNNVKLNYDPANFLYFGEDPIDALDDVLDLVGFTHFKSVKYENGKPKYCRIREGVIDYGRLFNKLLPDYKGYIGLEYEEPSDVEEGTIDDLNYLKGILS